ncbi:hypothetical protein OG292_02125 [Streptomyces sp. NBC_01511]
MAERLRAEAHLARTLGAEYFLDRANINGERVSLPSLTRAMNEAA